MDFSDISGVGLSSTFMFSMAIVWTTLPMNVWQTKESSWGEGHSFHSLRTAASVLQMTY